MSAAVTSPRGRTLLVVAIVFGALTVYATAGYLLAAPSWWGWTPTVVSGWTGYNTLIWVGAAALSAWSVYPVYGRSLAERIDLGVRSRRDSVLRSLVPLVVGVSLSGLAPLTVGLAWQSTVGLDSSTWPVLLLWILSTLMVGVFFVGFGAVTAMLIPSSVSLLLAAVAAYLIVLIPAYTVESVSWELLPPDFGLHFGNGVPPIAGVSMRLVFWSLAGAVLIAVISRARRICAALTVAVVATGVLASAVSDEFDTPREYAGVVCETEESTAVCVPQTYRAGMEAYASILREGLQQLPAELVPSAIVASPDLLVSAVPTEAEDRAGPVVVEPSNATVGMTNLPDRDETLIAFGNALWDAGACPGPQGTGDSAASAAHDPSFVLALWWKSELGMSLERTYGYSDAADPQLFDASDFEQARQRAERLAALPRSERDALLVGARSDSADCSAIIDEVL